LTRWEDEVLISQLNELGGYQWEAIAAHLPGRTDHAVRNRYHKLRRAKRRQEGEEPPITSGYKCGKCGQNKKGHICSVASDDEDGDVRSGDAPSYCLALPNVPPRSTAPASVKRASKSPQKKGLQRGSASVPPMSLAAADELSTRLEVACKDDDSMISNQHEYASEHQHTASSEQEYDSAHKKGTVIKMENGIGGCLTGQDVSELLEEFDLSLDNLEDLMGTLDSDTEEGRVPDVRASRKMPSFTRTWSQAAPPKLDSADFWGAIDSEVDGPQVPVVPVPPPLKRDLSSRLKSFNHENWRAREIDNLIDTYY